MARALPSFVREGTRRQQESWRGSRRCRLGPPLHGNVREPVRRGYRVPRAAQARAVRGIEPSGYSGRSCRHGMPGISCHTSPDYSRPLAPGSAGRFSELLATAGPHQGIELQVQGFVRRSRPGHSQCPCLHRLNTSPNAGTKTQILRWLLQPAPMHESVSLSGTRGLSHDWTFVRHAWC